MNLQQFFSNNTLPQNVLRVIFFVSFVGIFLTSALMYFASYRLQKKALLEHMEMSASVLSENCTAALLFSNKGDAEETLKSLRHDPNIISAKIYSEDGKTFAHYLREGYNSSNIQHEHFSGLEATSSIKWEGETLGHVELLGHLEELNQYSFNLLVIFINILLAVVLLTYFLGSSLQKVLTQPILSLTKEAESIAEKEDYSRRIPTKGTKDLVLLTHNINGMLAQIEKTTKHLENVRSFLWNVTDSMPSMLIGIDSKDQISYWNDRAQERSGIARSDAIGKNAFQCYPPLEKHRKTIHQVLNSGEATVLKHSNQSKERHFQMTYYPLSSGQGVVMRIDEITEHVNLQEALVQSEKMMSLGGLAAGMAHEINNPLAGILQNTDVIRRRLLDDLPANQTAAQESGVSLEAIKDYLGLREIEKFLNDITKSGQVASTIVKDMLDFSRPNQCHQDVASPIEVIEKAVDLATSDYELKTIFDIHAISFVREYEPEVPLIRMDSNRIQQVIFNLIKNAAQALNQVEPPENRTLILRCKPVENKILIEVADNGIGMDSETANRVFEPFFTTKKVGEGTGLGLSVSYFIITQNHEGEMTVRSSPGRGTTFSILLPVEVREVVT